MGAMLLRTLLGAKGSCPCFMGAWGAPTGWDLVAAQGFVEPSLLGWVWGRAGVAAEQAPL